MSLQVDPTAAGLLLACDKALLAAADGSDGGPWLGFMTPWVMVCIIALGGSDVMDSPPSRSALEDWLTAGPPGVMEPRPGLGPELKAENMSMVLDAGAGAGAAGRDDAAELKSANKSCCC